MDHPKKMPERVARYHRVSRLDQNPQLQEDETQAFLERRSWNLVATFVDHGVSGSREQRPELDRPMSEARRGKFDILLVWRSDRLFRSLRHMVNTLAELDALGVKFVSVTEAFDTTTPQGQLLIHLVSAFSEFERQVIIERTKAGVHAAKRRGARIGRPRVALDLEQLHLLKVQGWFLRKKATHIHVGVGTVQRALRPDPQGSLQVASEAA